MARDILKELTEEWYSEAETKPQSDEEVIDDELLEMHVLFKTRGTVFAGEEHVTVTGVKNKDEKK